MRNARIGILGDGQLARMLALAGRPLGQHVELLGDVRSEFSGPVEVVTFESESWSPQDVERLAGSAAVHPRPRALACGQDRRETKRLFARLGIPVPRHAVVEAGSDLGAAWARLGGPAVLKLARGGYDGRGQWRIRDDAEADRAAIELGNRAAVLEEFVPFERELSIVAVRGVDGELACYPLVENHHEHGCLRVSLAPAPGVDGALIAKAERMIRSLLEDLEYVGVLALELFEVVGPSRSRELLANEIAPRVHNSGHWTIEGAETSQFENHLRAITGLPVGSTRALGHCAMVNLLGTLPPAEQVLAVPGAHLHVYGKEPRPGRKLGHVTVRAASGDELARRLRALADRLDLALPPGVIGWMRSNC